MWMTWRRDSARRSSAARPDGRYALGGENAPQRRVFEILQQLTGRRPPPRIPFPIGDLMGAAEELRARLLGGTPLITRGAVEIFRHDWSLDSSDAIRDLGYTLTPLDEGVKQNAGSRLRGPRDRDRPSRQPFRSARGSGCISGRPVRDAAASAERLAVGRPGGGCTRVQRGTVAAGRWPAALPSDRSCARLPARHPALSAGGAAAGPPLSIAPRHRRGGLGDSGDRRRLRDVDRTITYRRNRRGRKGRGEKQPLCELRDLGGSIRDPSSVEPR